ncbi:MAG: signal recognition particle-docking protein FtsY, partial [Pelagibacteraceae bacterium]
EFKKICNLSGIIMTKLDGTAKGGVLIAIAEKFKLPIFAIGLGEKADDLQPFNADSFTKAFLNIS